MCGPSWGPSWGWSERPPAAGGGPRSRRRRAARQPRRGTIVRDEETLLAIEATRGVKLPKDARLALESADVEELLAVFSPTDRPMPTIRP